MKIKALFFTIATLGTISGTSLAEGIKIYPGTFCVGDGLASSSGVSFNWGVRAENKAATKKVVNCPIIRSGDSDRPASATIYVRDSSRDESVECKFQSWGASGTQRVESPMRFSGSGFVGSRTLTFTGLPTAPGNTYNFLCKLPHGSYISSYKIDEI